MEDEGGREELLLEVDFGEGVVEAAEGVWRRLPHHVPHGLEDYPYCTSRERRRCDRPHGEARSNRKGHHACRDVTIFSTILLMTSAVAGCALRR